MNRNNTFHHLTIILLLAIIIGVFTVTVKADQSEYSPVRFAIIGDRTGGHVPGVYGQIVTEIERLKPDFVMTVGDMIEGYADDTTRINAEWKEYFTLTEPLSVTIYYTPGNHDVWSDLSDSLYHKLVCETYYSFDYKNLHFIILDNSRWESGDKLPSEQIEWLIDDLELHREAAYTFVFYHKPFWYETIADNKPDTLHSLFVKFGVDAVFTGHYHDYFSGEYGGILYTGLGSSGGGTRPDPTGLEYHFAWVTVDNQGIHIAPIKMGSVLSWNVTTAAERKIFNPIRRSGIVFENPVTVKQNLTIKNTTLELTIDNTYSDFGVDDTLRWSVPDGWTIEPVSLPVKVEPRETKIFNFKADCSGKLYPVPTATVDFTYAEAKKVEAESDMRIARQAYCYPADTAPVIDGHISEDFWHKPVKHFYSPDGGDMDIDPVKFYFAYDKDNLYLAAYCQERKIDSLTAIAAERDGAVYGEDCIGYFIEPKINSDTVYQIYINALGTAFDQKLWLGEDGYMDGDRDWNGDYEVKTIKGSDFWSIEARIPVGQFGIAPKKDQKWGLNFRRKQKRFNSAADWQVPISYYPNTFGVLIMR